MLFAPVDRWIKYGNRRMTNKANNVNQLHGTYVILGQFLHSKVKTKVSESRADL
jgi:hypothetical protein